MNEEDEKNKNNNETLQKVKVKQTNNSWELTKEMDRCPRLGESFGSSVSGGQSECRWEEGGLEGRRPPAWLLERGLRGVGEFISLTPSFHIQCI